MKPACAVHNDVMLARELCQALRIIQTAWEENCFHALFLKDVDLALLPHDCRYRKRLQLLTGGVAQLREHSPAPFSWVRYLHSARRKSRDLHKSSGAEKQQG